METPKYSRRCKKGYLGYINNDIKIVAAELGIGDIIKYNGGIKYIMFESGLKPAEGKIPLEVTRHLSNPLHYYEEIFLPNYRIELDPVLHMDDIKKFRNTTIEIPKEFDFADFIKITNDIHVMTFYNNNKYIDSITGKYDSSKL